MKNLSRENDPAADKFNATLRFLLAAALLLATKNFELTA
jgi:hypothetical protein